MGGAAAEARRRCRSARGEGARAGAGEVAANTPVVGGEEEAEGEPATEPDEHYRLYAVSIVGFEQADS